VLYHLILLHSVHDLPIDVDEHAAGLAQQRAEHLHVDLRIARHDRLRDLLAPAARRLQRRQIVRHIPLDHPRRLRLPRLPSQPPHFQGPRHRLRRHHRVPPFAVGNIDRSHSLIPYPLSPIPSPQIIPKSSPSSSSPSPSSSLTPAACSSPTISSFVAVPIATN